MNIRKIKPKDDAALAGLIRKTLKAYKLDIPGTAYFDENLDHLSDYYMADESSRAYFVMTDDDDNAIGGVGIAHLDEIEDCAELQKLYLDERYLGQGLSYKLMTKAKEAALELGYRRLYLETHDNLDIAIHLYERCGFVEIDRPDFVVHSTMTRFFLKELIAD